MSLEHSLWRLSLLQMAFQLGLCESGLLNVFQIKVPKFTVFQVNVPASPSNFFMHRKYTTYLLLSYK